MQFHLVSSHYVASELKLLALCGLLSGCAISAADPSQQELDSDEQVERASHALAGQAANFWIPRYHERQTTIPVCFEPGANWTTAERQSIESLASVWEFPGGADLYFHGTCGSSFPGIRIGRSTDGRCSSRIGAAGFNVANGMKLADAYNAHCVRHEFAHALGFTHEQERTDSTCSASRGGAVPDVYLTPFDTNSIMSGCAGAWTPSLLDIAGVLSVYGGGDTAVSSGKVAIRTAAGTYLRYNPTATTPGFYVRDGIALAEQFIIDSGSGQPISYGQAVTIRTRQENLYMNVVGGALKPGSYAFAASQWRIYHAMFPTATGTVKVHEPVALQSTTGLYLSKPASGGVRVIGARAGGPNLEEDAWRFHTLVYAP